MKYIVIINMYLYVYILNVIQFDIVVTYLIIRILTEYGESSH